MGILPSLSRPFPRHQSSGNMQSDCRLRMQFVLARPNPNLILFFFFFYILVSLNLGQVYMDLYIKLTDYKTLCNKLIVGI